MTGFQWFFKDSSISFKDYIIELGYSGEQMSRYFDRFPIKFRVWSIAILIDIKHHPYFDFKDHC